MHGINPVYAVYDAYGIREFIGFFTDESLKVLCDTQLVIETEKVTNPRKVPLQHYRIQKFMKTTKGIEIRWESLWDWYEDLYGITAPKHEINYDGNRPPQ